MGLCFKAHVERPSTDDYGVEVTAAIERGDFHTARLCAQRLVDLGHPPAEVVFLLANIELKAGRPTVAMEWLATLAPDDGRGLSQAHHLMAMILLERARTAGTADGLERAEMHLRRALAGKDISRGSTTAALALITAAADDPTEAFTLLEALRGSRQLGLSALNLALASCRVLSARLQSGSIRATPARVGTLRGVCEKYLRDAIPRQLESGNPELLARIACAQVLLGKPAEAVNILSHGGSGEMPESIRRALAWSLAALCADQHDIANRTSTLAKAWRAAPKDARLLRRLLDLAGPEHRVEFMAHVDLAVDETPALAFYVGTGLLIAGEPELALPRLVAAHEAFGDEGPHHANNLAMCLLKLPGGGRAAEALALVDGKLAHHPDDPVLLDTKGQALIQLGQYREAIAILERILDVLEHPSRSLEGVALAYERLGQHALGKRYRALAARQDDRERTTLSEGGWAALPR